VRDRAERGRKKGEEKKRREIWTCVREKEKKRKEGEEIGWGHVARREWLRIDNKILPTNRVMPCGKGRFFLFLKPSSELKWDPILLKPFHLIINI